METNELARLRSLCLRWIKVQAERASAEGVPGDWGSVLVADVDGSASLLPRPGCEVHLHRQVVELHFWRAELQATVIPDRLPDIDTVIHEASVRRGAGAVSMSMVRPILHAPAPELGGTEARVLGLMRRFRRRRSVGCLKEVLALVTQDDQEPRAFVHGCDRTAVFDAVFPLLDAIERMDEGSRVALAMTAFEAMHATLSPGRFMPGYIEPRIAPGRGNQILYYPILSLVADSIERERLLAITPEGGWLRDDWSAVLGSFPKLGSPDVGLPWTTDAAPG